MYCAKCGSQLVASANFCHVCGTKVGGAQAQAAHSASPVYEVSETTFIMTKDRGFSPWNDKATWQWIAVANGPKGKYNAAVSQEFKARYLQESNWRAGPSHHAEAAKDALDELVAALLSSGWEPVVNDGYRPNFRRRVN